MIIRLIPPTPVTVILFTVSFNLQLPPPQPLSQFYGNQINLLSQHELEQPTSHHSLDKATWLITCLNEVVFDLSRGNGLVIVRCTFIDGDVKEWTFRDAKCTRDLTSVFRDVEWSSTQAEREKYEQSGMQPQQPEVESQPKKHKKQRSLLMTLVSSLVPSTPNRSRAPSPTPPPPPPPPPSGLSSHALRRRARSTLVDSFRRYVIAGLTPYFPPGSYGCGYVSFIIRSMLRRNEERMEVLLREAGLNDMYDMALRLSQPNGNGHGSPSDPVFFDDEDGEETSLESRSTDTDGSSVHTPTDSPNCSPFIPGPPSPTIPKSPTTPKGRPIRGDMPRTPTPPSPGHSSASPRMLNNINALNSTSHRLQHLLGSLAQSRAVTDADEKQMYAVLEIKSRRRAWSNRALLDGASISDVGFGMPERSSPLARNVVTAEDLRLEAEVNRGLLGMGVGGANGMEEGWNGSELVKRMKDLELKRSPSKMSLNSVSRLFPVTEEDEEVDLQTTSRVALDMFDHDQEQDQGQDLEGGVGTDPGYGATDLHASFGGEDFDGMTPSVRLVEDAENGLLMPLPLPLTPPISPTSGTSSSSNSAALSTPSSSPTFSSWDGSLYLPPPRRERKRSMMNRPSLPPIDPGAAGVQHDAEALVPTPFSSQSDLTRVFHPPPSPPYTTHCSHPDPHPAYSSHRRSHHQQSRSLTQNKARLYGFDPQTKIEIFDANYDDMSDESDSELDPASSSISPSGMGNNASSLTRGATRASIGIRPSADPFAYRSYPSIAETEEPEEFTLAMDVSPPGTPTSCFAGLPLPVTMSMTMSGGGGGGGVGGGGGGERRYGDCDEWIVDVGVGVRCR